MDKDYQVPMPVKWADSAMFTAEPHEWDEGMGVVPRITLLRMTHDPLGAVAAMSEMYKGHVVRDLDRMTDETRMQAFIDVSKTHLNTPFEAIDLHFLEEGVDRAYTHQHVRQRTAVFAQESLRFAVVEDLVHAVSLPPSLHGLKEDHPWRIIWDQTIQNIADHYLALVEAGMPQEDARGLLPHATATRMHYKSNLRNFIEHAGNRLCTQAQFHWRIVYAQMIMGIREYGYRYDPDNSWQYELIAGSSLFRPACYQKGHCPFNADFDRGCKIKSRVEAFADSGVQSSAWGGDEDGLVTLPSGSQLVGIRDEEWLLNPSAARFAPGQ